MTEPIIWMTIGALCAAFGHWLGKRIYRKIADLEGEDE